MKKFTLEERLNRLKKLHPELRDFIGSDEIVSFLQETTEQYGLHIDQEGVLGDYINYVLLGLIPAAEFPKELSENMEGVSEDLVRKIISDTDKKIFEKMREKIKKPPKYSRANKNASPEVNLVNNAVKENVAKEDNTIRKAPPNLPTGNIVEEKLANAPHIADEKDVAKKKVAPEIKKEYVADPYREPIE